LHLYVFRRNSYFEKKKLENTEGPIKNGKYKKIGNIGQTRPNTKTNKATTQYANKYK
jgi:hypothetical protein